MRYGWLTYTRSFSRLLPRYASLLYFRSVSTGATIARPYPFKSVPALKYFASYGFSTVCASATPPGLTLAPGSLGADEPSSKNLRLSTNMILTHFALLIPAFLLVSSPPPLPLRLHPVYNALLPYLAVSQASVYSLAPLNFRRRVTRPVSYYALF